MITQYLHPGIVHVVSNRGCTGFLFDESSSVDAFSEVSVGLKLNMGCWPLLESLICYALRFPISRHNTSKRENVGTDFIKVL